MNFDRKNLSNEKLLDLYRRILKPRLIEEKMLILIRQGKVSKWFSGIGQEAISVGVTAVLDTDDPRAAAERLQNTHRPLKTRHECRLPDAFMKVFD